MQLLTYEILKQFQDQGDTSNKTSDQIKVIVKYFNPFGAGNWYAVEFNSVDKTFFGYANIGDDDCAELGYFSLTELQGLETSLGISIERDLYFGEHSLQDVINSKGRL